MSIDPLRISNQLFQCLTQDKKPLGILMGAGCPYSIKTDSDQPLIPNIKELTEEVKKTVLEKNYSKQWNNIYLQITDDGINEPNIEDILSRVRGLRAYAGRSDIKGLSRSDLEDIENIICESIIVCVDKKLPNKHTPYNFLSTWVGAIERTEPVELFTTNYDTLIEQSLEDLQIPFFDGFIGSCEPFFDPYAIEFDKLPSRWAKVWKIHGSINWKSHASDDSFKVIRTSNIDSAGVLIHPSHLKYEQSRKMPYLAMMDKLKKFLSTPSSVLIIIGYSFGDQHLNDVIVQSLQGTPTAAVFALMFDILSKCRIASKIAKDRGNLTIVAKDGAVIGTKESIWIEKDEKPDSSFPVETIEWKKGAGEDDPWKAEFTLGDFNNFGRFLQEISGSKA